MVILAAKNRKKYSEEHFSFCLEGKKTSLLSSGLLGSDQALSKYNLLPQQCL